MGRYTASATAACRHATVRALGVCVLRDQQQVRRWEENLKMCKEHREGGGGCREGAPRSWGVGQGGESAHGTD